MNIRRITALFLAALATAAILCSCKKETAAPEDTYTGVLTKVRLGMPMKKVVSLNPDTELYYDSDNEIWCVNPDTDIMGVKDYIPSDNNFYGADDSLITYTFKYNEKDEENYLTAYLQEVRCLIDRENAEKYYEDKKLSLAKKYGAKSDAVSSTTTGTEGVDQKIDCVTVYTLSSFKVTFKMQLSYETVDGITGYYGSYYSIEVRELENKTAVEAPGIPEEKE